MLALIMCGFTDYIQPICLPSSTYPEIKYGKYYSIAGWGKTQSGNNVI